MTNKNNQMQMIPFLSVEKLTRIYFQFIPFGQRFQPAFGTKKSAHGDRIRQKMEQICDTKPVKVIFIPTLP